jgi:hypothetical protein
MSCGREATNFAAISIARNHKSFQAAFLVDRGFNAPFPRAVKLPHL